MKNTNENSEIKIKCYSCKELRGMYGIDQKTFKKWIAPYEKEIGKRCGNIYFPKQVEKIFEKLGVPGKKKILAAPVSITEKTISENKKNEPNNELIEELENVFEYIDAAWDFAQAVLWSGKTFSAEEITDTKTLLFDFFIPSLKFIEELSMKKRLSVFCQRILLTRCYIDFMPQYRFVPSPAVWFDENFKYGFCGTSKWMEKIQDVRSITPQYREELEKLAEFYLEYIKSKSLSVSNKATEYLVEKKSTYLIKIFCACISEIHAKYFSKAA